MKGKGFVELKHVRFMFSKISDLSKRRGESELKMK